MADTLVVASDKKAYTLSDGATFLNYEAKLNLKILLHGDPMLKNQYSVIAVNPDKFPSAKYREAMDFIAFVTSVEGQGIIASYIKHSSHLFYPDAVTSVIKR
jgi:tungstate transport system substrate-binding protein